MSRPEGAGVKRLVRMGAGGGGGEPAGGGGGEEAS